LLNVLKIFWRLQQEADKKIDMRKPKFWWEKKREEKKLLEEAKLIIEKLKMLDYEFASDIIDELRTKLIDEYNAMIFALIPGLGHIYAKRFWEGIMIFFLVMFTFGLGIPLWIWSIFDARRKARVYNAKVLKEVAEQYGLLYI